MILPESIKLKKELKRVANPKRAKTSQRFFKTGRGEYGEGDVFLGINTPQQRKIAAKYNNLSLTEIKKLLKEKIHECRFIALVILIKKYQKVEQKEKKQIFEFYLNNSKKINNWDLVDISAPKIIGDYLLDKKNKKILYQLAKSNNLWQKRIAILATFSFIKNNEFEHTFKISKLLFNDQHDLIHKAIGWMLREVGNKNQKQEELFLKKYSKQMPRTALRYAIEKFDEKKRKEYLEP
ncbi:MAG: DNA alkylation repair protein [Patescibacteria group bacterium]|jgi:3-methyladenine DNA glycosylase AlkD|nr:DNA alkylation repair protein [Patescibacteria group bacterium]MDD5172702.1 DNA alkylation repair protein [Patescibacteria group bacterium]